MKRLLILGHDQGCKEHIAHLFDRVDAVGKYMALYPDDVLLFEGGTDVNPSFYGEKSGKYTDNPANPRDESEKTIFKEAQRVGAGFIGVCRGSQFLTVMNGGKLIQHVSGHGRDHYMATYDARTIKVTSTHHQMMAPQGKNFKLLGWAATNQSKVYLDGNDKDCFEKLNPTLGLEPEIVWYPETRSLACQSHPEYLDANEELPQYFIGLIKKFIFEEK